MNESEKKWLEAYDRLIVEAKSPEARAGCESKRLFELREKVINEMWRDLVANQKLLGGKDRCLDVGCNVGYFTALAAKLGLKMVGVDFSTKAVEEARTLYSDIEFVQGDVYQLPFSDGQFAGIGCFGVIQTLSERQKGLREIWRVLKPGGMMVLETNMRQPVLLSLARQLSYVLTGKSSLGQAWTLFKQTSLGHYNPAIESAYFKPKTIIDEVRSLGAVDIKVYPSPGASRIQPGWILALGFKKPS